MYLELYYFSFSLLESYKEETLIISIKTDLNNFFIYHFWKKFTKSFKNNKIKANLYINNNQEIIIPKLVFQIEWDLTENQINEILDIFSNHWEENFILNTKFNIWENKFLNLNKDILKFLKKAKKDFEEFVKYFWENKLIDVTDSKYKKFRKTYNLFFYLNYYLLKTYKHINLEKNKLKEVETNLAEFKWNIKILDKRLELDKESLEKNIIIYADYVNKVLNIIKNLIDKKM